MSGRPCKSVNRRDCYFNETEYWLGNKVGFMYRYKGRPIEDVEKIVRAEYRRYVETGHFPPLCPKCGVHHRPLKVPNE